MSADDYRQMLHGLMPQGPAWPTDPGSETDLMLDGTAQEFARLDARIAQLTEEADPRTTYELLADWERACGLPTKCMVGTTQTIAQRRAALIGRLTDIGGQRPIDYINLAASFGYTITITEFRPWNCAMPINLPICGLDWAYAFQINAPLHTQTFFSCISGVNEPLSSWGNTQLECLVKSRSPAHTISIFSYT